MEAFRDGDAEAFRTLVHRHQRSLYSTLLRWVGNPSRAEELLQEVLLRVVRSKGRYTRSAKFTTWLYTIARNLSVDESRRARFRRHRSLDAPLGPSDSGTGTLGASVPMEQVPVDAAAEGQRIRQRVAAALQSLPEDQREVFCLRQFAGLSFREIAEVAGVPENTVKSRMRYALEKLRRELGDLRGHKPTTGDKELVHG